MERELVMQAKLGDRSAFETLTKAYIRRIYRLAYRFLGNMDDAMDVCQDVFIRAQRSFGRFDESRPLYPWLHQITKNLCLSHNRRPGRTDGSITEEDSIVAESPGPEAETLRSLERERLHAALAGLSQQHREIIRLKHFDECSYAEIADMLGIPIGTVMSRLYGARKKLKKRLLDMEEGA